MLLPLLLLLLLAVPAAAQGTQRALLVGCDRFVTQEDTWPASANNVYQLASVLRGGTSPMAAMTTRRSGIAGVDALEALVAQTFAGADEGDVSWFYISTHGLWRQGQTSGETVLLLSDGTHEEALTAARLKAIFDTVPGKKILLMDACHSGAMIGKGVLPPFDNLFAGEDYIILCSSGGSEESWLWSGASETARLAGAGYFSGALVGALSAQGGYAADANRDGQITLTELRHWLREQHGASTVQTYPEASDFPLLTYDSAAAAQRQIAAPVTRFAFEDGSLQPGQTDITFSFTVVHAVQVAYQIVYQRGGRWDFASAGLQYDDTEGSAAGWLTPGYQERTIHLEESPSPDSFGYALLQVLTIDNGSISIAASRLLCVPPAEGDPQLAVVTDDAFTPAAGEELVAVALHTLPCDLTAWVEDEHGQTVRRLRASEATRPEQLALSGTTLVWDGTDADGATADAGRYRLHIRTKIGATIYEAWSALFELRQET